MSHVKYTPCPICHKKTTLDPQNVYRPFCSERCKLIDLGEWANESRRIPAEEAPLSESMDDKE
jgi:endogenous inhibitor of DNA gyrase (YacG/DUF329 family)